MSSNHEARGRLAPVDLTDSFEMRAACDPPASSAGLSTRRTVLRGGLAFAGALALPAFIERAHSAPPSERLRVGHVGLGGRGTSLLGANLKRSSIDVLAVCDVDAGHLARARASAGERAEAYGDYRRVLERGDIDGIVCATPDHWHAPVTIAACAAGKHVYCEKPLSHNIREGRAMVDAARKHDRVVQVGIHHRSAEYVRHIVRIVQGGRIGRVRMVRNWMWGNKVEKRTPGTLVPKDLDYDFWLGPAPEREFHPGRVHYNFRWCSDYAGGYMTDWGVHMFNVVTFAMGVDHKGPDFVEAHATWAEDNLYDFPVTMEARWEFSDPDFTLTWTQPEDGGDVLPGEKYAMTFYGEEGELRTGFGDGLAKYYVGGKEAPLPREGREVEVPESRDHTENWVESIRAQRPPIADVEIGHRTTALCLLGNVAMRAGRMLRWDWQNERFPDHPEFDRLLGREAREHRYGV